MVQNINTQQAGGNIANINGNVQNLNVGVARPQMLKGWWPAFVWQAEHTNRFHFAAQATAMLGRERELEQLRAFCKDDRRFLWWGVEGPGGTGKSRLALELGLTMRQEGWDTLFLGSGEVLANNLDCLRSGTFQPERPTLLILDYAASVADQLNPIMLCLCHMAGEGRFEHSLRFLLLERSTENLWYQKLYQSPSNGERLLMEDRAFQQDFLKLPALATEQARQLLEEALGRYPSATEKHTQKLPAAGDEILSRLGESPSPLLLLFLADALKHPSSEHPTWDTRELLSYVLKREQMRWVQSGFNEHDAALLRFATLTEAIKVDCQNNYVSSLLEKVEIEHSGKAFQQRWSALIPRLYFDRIPKLEPDLLGELFVLETLPLPQNPWAEKGEAGLPELQAAWEVGQGSPLVTFLCRVFEDFPSHSNWEPFYEHVIKAAPAGWDEQKAILHAQMSMIAAKRHDFDDSKKFLQAISATERANNIVCAIVQAMATFNLITAYGNAGKLEAARPLYEDLVQLRQDFPEHQEVALEQARAAVNLIAVYGNAGEPEAARLLYADLVRLRQGFPKDQEVALEQARAAVNLIAFYGNTRKLEAARPLYDEDLVQLQQDFPEHQEVALEQGKAAVNLIAFYGNAGELEAARPLYDEDLVRLRQDFPEHQELALVQAMAAVNLIVDYRNAGELAAARLLYADLVRLRQDFPEHQEVALRQAKAAVNLIAVYGNAGEPEAARPLYADLVRLTKNFPEDEEIAQAQHRAGLILELRYQNAGETEKAERLGAALRQPG